RHIFYSARVTVDFSVFFLFSLCNSPQNGTALSHLPAGSSARSALFRMLHRTEFPSSSPRITPSRNIVPMTDAPSGTMPTTSTHSIVPVQPGYLPFGEEMLYRQLLHSRTVQRHASGSEPSLAM